MPRLWGLLRRAYRLARRLLSVIRGRGGSDRPRRGALGKWLAVDTLATPFIAHGAARALRSKAQQGFGARAVGELELLAQRPVEPERRVSALWELTLLLSNQSDGEAAARSIDFLEALDAIPANGVPWALRATIQAECLLKSGRWEEARKICLAAATANPHDPNLRLACANLYADAPSGALPQGADADALRLEWINAVFIDTGLEPLEQAGNSLALDRLQVRVADNARRKGGPLVTVIVPVYNAGPQLATALRSLLEQTWVNLEILVVDDCSTDETAALVRGLAQEDDRLRLLQADENGGPYVARNLGLLEAKGEFVTTHDGDDWSHPRKIECQVEHLLANPGVLANLSAHVRATEHLVFSRRGNPGFYIFPNMSSLMFRREAVLEKVGYWDCVRFGGDSEFKKRLERVFGQDKVQSLSTGPLSILRVHDASLTANPVTGYNGYKVGARREYDEGVAFWHSQQAEGRALYMPFPCKQRPFAAPYIMRTPQGKAERHFDVILVSDFRLDGGTTSSNINEIRACRRLGLRVGLVQCGAYLLRPGRKVHTGVRALIDGDGVQMLVWGERARADLVLVRFPLVLQDETMALPEVKGTAVKIIANQPPQRTRNDHSDLLYDIDHCDRRAAALFGAEPVWHPIGPMAREGLEELKPRITLAEEDWVNLIELADWEVDRTAPRSGAPIVIGRHSRDHWVKWPDRAADLLAAYPQAGDLVVKVLGGAQVPKRLLKGRLPGNWEVHAFGSMEPKEFLAGLDVFVYYPHPRYLEAFGRSIFEAMAVGVPVVLPPQFQPVFGEAALYAEPEDVERVVRALAGNSDAYMQRVRAGRAFVAANFGYEMQRRRLEPWISALGHVAVAQQD